jgi:cell division protein FtsB
MIEELKKEIEKLKKENKELKEDNKKLAQQIQDQNNLVGRLRDKELL